MADPEVIASLNRWRAKLMAHEAEQMRAMAQRWQMVETALKASQLDLAMYLDELRLKGETITPARLMQMERYRAMIADARGEQTKYSEWAAQEIENSQRQGVGDGIDQGADAIMAAMRDAKLMTAFDRINTEAVDFLAGFAADGSPLYDLLRASYPKSVLKLTDALVKGLATGAGPRATAKMMQDAMGGNFDRALLIARTEQIRALRAGSLAQMGESNVVKGYVRRAQRNSETCAACLALDGTEQARDEIFASHPACRCYAAPLLKYGKTPQFPSGQEWLSTQPEAVQRQILGAGKYDLFKAGVLDWGKVAKIKHDPVWGDTVGVGNGR